MAVMQRASSASMEKPRSRTVREQGGEGRSIGHGSVPGFTDPIDSSSIQHRLQFTDEEVRSPSSGKSNALSLAPLGSSGVPGRLPGTQTCRPIMLSP